MKTLIVFVAALLISVSLSAQSYKIVRWRMMGGNVIVQVELPNNTWLAFNCDSNTKDFNYVLTHGCVLTRYSAEMWLGEQPMKYVTRRDEEYIKQSFGIERICNKPE